MKQLILLFFIFLSLTSYCQENQLLPHDSLLKMNRVKKAFMLSTSRKNNGRGEMVYHYNEKGDLIKSNSVNPMTSQSYIITDYFFDTSGKRYASMMHGTEEYSSSRSTNTGYQWVWQPRFQDSIINFYVYNENNKLSRIYRKYVTGELMFESLYSYDPFTITRRSYNKLQQLMGETREFYEKEQFIVKSISNRYDSSGQLVSTFTQNFENVYNEAGQVTEVNYRNDTCSCISKYKYYSNGLLKSRKNEFCLYNKKFIYKYYK